MSSTVLGYPRAMRSDCKCMWQELHLRKISSMCLYCILHLTLNKCQPGEMGSVAAILELQL